MLLRHWQMRCLPSPLLLLFSLAAWLAWQELHDMQALASAVRGGAPPRAPALSALATSAKALSPSPPSLSAPLPPPPPAAVLSVGESVSSLSPSPPSPSAPLPPPPPAAVLSVGESVSSLSPARAALRAATASYPACAERAAGAEPAFFFDALMTAAPAGSLRRCGAAELAAAFSRATRAAPGAPLVVPGTCTVSWLAGEAACRVLAAVGGLELYGDSLSRHLLQALREALLADYSRGLTAHMPGGADASLACGCIGAFDDGHLRRFPGDPDVERDTFCREHSLAYLSTAELRAAAWPGFCPNWGEADHLPQHLRVPHWDAEMPGVHADRAPGGVVALQGGLHFEALDESTAGAVFSWRKPGATRHILINLHAPGLNKPVEYLAAFGDAHTRAFNAIVAGIVAGDPVNLLLLDAYAATAGQLSVDGVHYGHESNAVLAQIMLNILDSL